MAASGTWDFMAVLIKCSVRPETKGRCVWLVFVGNYLYVRPLMSLFVPPLVSVESFLELCLESHLLQLFWTQNFIHLYLSFWCQLLTAFYKHVISLRFSSKVLFWICVSTCSNYVVSRTLSTSTQVRDTNFWLRIIASDSSPFLQ